MPLVSSDIPRKVVSPHPAPYPSRHPRPQQAAQGKEPGLAPDPASRSARFHFGRSCLDSTPDDQRRISPLRLHRENPPRLHWEQQPPGPTLPATPPLATPRAAGSAPGLAFQVIMYFFIVLSFSFCVCVCQLLTRPIPHCLNLFPPQGPPALPLNVLHARLDVARCPMFTPCGFGRERLLAPATRDLLWSTAHLCFAS